VKGDYDVPAAFPASVVAPRGDGISLPRSSRPDRRLAAEVMRSLERVWEPIFAQAGDDYVAPGLVLVGEPGAPEPCTELRSDAVYCDRERTIDLDVSRTGTDWPYALAHEVGHHVAELRGTSAEAAHEISEHRGFRNDIRVRQELQAECYAGIWAYAAGLPARPGAIASGATPEHGTGQQRELWFGRGLNTGRPAECDTFAPRDIDG
jgi:hypothetical protein